MRCFVAVAMPPEIRARLAGLQRDLSRDVDGVRWLRADAMHLTLCFLGECDDVTRASIGAALASSIPGSTGLLHLRVIGVGRFPRTGRARVIWCGIAGAVEDGDDMERLEALHDRVRGAAERGGARLESRPFRPHLTLGRFKVPAAARSISAALEPLNGAEMGDLTVRRVSLYRSVLTRDGAEHTEIAGYEL